MERSYPKRNRQSTGTSGGASAGNAPKRPRRSAGDVAGFGDGPPLPGGDDPAWRPSSSSSSGGNVAVVGGRGGGGSSSSLSSSRWARVCRPPMSPLGKPYFGSGPTANFSVPTWVRVDELTPEERRRYDEEEGEREKRWEGWTRVDVVGGASWGGGSSGVVTGGGDGGGGESGGDGGRGQTPGGRGR